MALYMSYDCRQSGQHLPLRRRKERACLKVNKGIVRAAGFQNPLSCLNGGLSCLNWHLKQATGISSGTVASSASGLVIFDSIARSAAAAVPNHDCGRNFMCQSSCTKFYWNTSTCKLQRVQYELEVGLEKCCTEDCSVRLLQVPPIFALKVVVLMCLRYGKKYR